MSGICDYCGWCEESGIAHDCRKTLQHRIEEARYRIETLNVTVAAYDADRDAIRKVVNHEYGRTLSDCVIQRVTETEQQLAAVKQLLREILDELSGDKHYWHSCSQWRERAKEVDSDRT
jgi:CHASE3 domain sensor protein